jgi:hypothetical protein
MSEVQLVQKTGVAPLSKLITQQLTFGWVLYGTPFDYQGNPAQLMVKGDVPTLETGEYRLIEKDGKMSMEVQLTALLDNGWTLYGNPFVVYGLSAQAVVKGNVPSLPGPSGTGEIPPDLLSRVTAVEDKATDALSGLAVLDGKLLTKANLLNGKVPYEQLPEFPVGRKIKVTDQAERLALSVYADLTIAYQTDTGDAWGLDANDNPAVAGNWSKLGNAQALGVASFNGRTGNIAPQAGDYSASLIAETADRRFVSTEQIAQWNQAPNPGLIDTKIAEQKVADDLVYETKQHATATFLAKADLPAPVDTSGFMLKTLQDAANGVAPLGADRKVPLANLPSVIGTSEWVIPVSSYTDVKATRAASTWYKNSGQYDRHVRVMTNSIAGKEASFMHLRDKSGAMLILNSVDVAGSVIYSQLMQFVVPAGWDYQIVLATVTPRTIASWFEVNMVAGSTFTPVSEKGKASGVAPLDNAGRVPLLNLPSHLPQAKREWRDVKASRVVGTYYKNNTGSEQVVCVRHKSLTASGRFTQIVVRFSSATKWYDFTTMKNGSIGTQEEVTALVPIGWEYAVTTAGGTTDISLLDTWYELGE